MRSGEDGPAGRKRSGSIVGSADASMRPPTKDVTPRACPAPRVAGQRPDRRPAPFCWAAPSPRPRPGIGRRRLGPRARPDDANADIAPQKSGVGGNSDIPREVDDRTLWHDIVTSELLDDEPPRRNSGPHPRRQPRPRTLRALVASLIESSVVLAAIFAIPVIVWTLRTGQSSDDRPAHAQAGRT